MSACWNLFVFQGFISYLLPNMEESISFQNSYHVLFLKHEKLWHTALI